MSKDMTEAEKARDYDRIYSALAEANQALGKQSMEVEQLRKRLAKHEPREKFVEVSLEVRGRIAASDLYSVPPDWEITIEDIDNVIEEHGGILDFVREFEEYLSVEENVSLVEE
jgi:SOS response regulatory protein OraA/RecX